jgi:hypothetical protein
MNGKSFSVNVQFYTCSLQAAFLLGFCFNGWYWHKDYFNPLNAELNSICHLLALLGGATIVVVSRLRVNPRMYYL